MSKLVVFAIQLTPNTVVWSVIFGVRLKALLVTCVQRGARNLPDTSKRKWPWRGMTPASLCLHSHLLAKLREHWFIFEKASVSFSQTKHLQSCIFMRGSLSLLVAPCCRFQSPWHAVYHRLVASLICPWLPLLLCGIWHTISVRVFVCVSAHAWDTGGNESPLHGSGHSVLRMPGLLRVQ